MFKSSICHDVTIYALLTTPLYSLPIKDLVYLVYLLSEAKFLDRKIRLILCIFLLLMLWFLLCQSITWMGKSTLLQFLMFWVKNFALRNVSKNENARRDLSKIGLPRSHPWDWAELKTLPNWMFDFPCLLEETFRLSLSLSQLKSSEISTLPKIFRMNEICRCGRWICSGQLIMSCVNFPQVLRSFDLSG